MEPISGTPGEQPPADEFGLVLDVAWSRLREASGMNSAGYVHVREDEVHPITAHRVATFVLAESYQGMLQGAERFTVSMPVDDHDPAKFVAAEDPEYAYVVVGQPGDYDSHVVVRRDTYEGGHGPVDRKPIENFLFKLATYSVVPYIKRVTPG